MERTGCPTVPAGVPTILAFEIYSSNLSETEARQCMSEGGQDSTTADKWIAQLGAAGFFSGIPGTETQVTQPADPGEDGGPVLWAVLKRELSADEHGFKHRLVELDSVVKAGGNHDLKSFLRVQ